jgi:hypothetical protein
MKKTINMRETSNKLWKKKKNMFRLLLLTLEWLSNLIWKKVMLLENF